MKEQLKKCIHEMKTPLTVVQGFVKSLAPQDLTKPANRDIYPSIGECITRIKQILVKMEEIADQMR